MAVSRNYLNRRRWAIDQQKKARAFYIAQYHEKDAMRLAELRKLAGMLQGQPHMESTLATVKAEIMRMEGSDPK